MDSLFTTCIKQGKSSRAICETLKRAIDGSYHHKGYSERTKDVGVLVLAIGGPRLVYTFNKLNLLLSSDVIRKHGNLTKPRDIYFSYSKTFEEVIDKRLSDLILKDNNTHLYR